MATRLQEQETQLITDIQFLRTRVAGLEEKQMQKEEERLSLALERSGIEKLAIAIDSTLLEQVTELSRLRESVNRDLDSTRKVLSEFMDTAKCEMDAHNNDIAESLRGIEADHSRFKEEFNEYVEKERARTEQSYQMAGIMKDMEVRTWPWRLNMERSCSSSPSREPSREQHSFQESSQPEMRAEWKPWSSAGIVPPAKPAPARTTAPCRSSRPGSARGARPVSEREGEHLSVPGAVPQVSAGSGLAVARLRQTSPQ